MGIQDIINAIRGGGAPSAAPPAPADSSLVASLQDPQTRKQIYQSALNQLMAQANKGSLSTQQQGLISVYENEIKQAEQEIKDQQAQSAKNSASDVAKEQAGIDAVKAAQTAQRDKNQASYQQGQLGLDAQRNQIQQQANDLRAYIDSGNLAVAQGKLSLDEYKQGYQERQDSLNNAMDLYKTQMAAEDNQLTAASKLAGDAATTTMEAYKDFPSMGAQNAISQAIAGIGQAQQTGKAPIVNMPTGGQLSFNPTQLPMTALEGAARAVAHISPTAQAILGLSPQQMQKQSGFSVTPPSTGLTSTPASATNTAGNPLGNATDAAVGFQAPGMDQGWQTPAQSGSFPNS